MSIFDTIGTIATGGLYNPGAEDAAVAQRDAQFLGQQEQTRQFNISNANFQPYNQAGYTALNQLMSGINSAPGVPNLPGYNVQTPNLNQFGGQAVAAPTLQSAPTLEQFQFDPSQITNDPGYQFQLEQGNQALSRQAGKSGLLNSGQRMIAAQQFGQGLASTAVNDAFNRQLSTNQQRNSLMTQQQGLANQTALSQFGLGSQNLGQQIDINNSRNQTATNQYGMNNQGYQNNVNQLLQQYSLNQGNYNDRLNRLAGVVNVGSGAGENIANLGQNYANNMSQTYQNIGDINSAAAQAPVNTFLNFANTAASLYGASKGKS